MAPTAGETRTDGAPLRLRALLACLAASAALLLAATPATGQSVELNQFGGQTFGAPYYVAGDPTDPSRVFVVEGGGTIRLVENGATQPTPFLTIPEVFVGIPGEDPCNDCGLFSMAFAPDFETSGLFYVFYTRDSPGLYYHLRIEEYRRSAADPDLADPTSGRIVLEIPHLDSSIHNGGQLQFGPDGLLYISVGDGGPQGDPNENGQDTGTLLGKLLRIDPAGTAPGEYSIPADNPFAGDAPGDDEVYAYGLRNPWRFSFDRLTGDLTIGDVGHASLEEVDFVPRGEGSGANFGWNCFEGSQPYSNAPASCAPAPANHTSPVLEYPNPSPGMASVSGGYVIRDGALPSLLGRYIYADIFDVFDGELRTARLFTGGSSDDSGLGVSATNVVSFGEDACAHIYVATIGGTVYRLEPATGPFPCSPQTADATPPPPALSLPPPAPVPSNAFTIGGLKKKTLSVKVSAPGTVEVKDAAAQRSGSEALAAAKRRLHSSSAAGGPGTIQVVLSLTKAAKKKLSRRGKVAVTAAVTFTPTAGTANSQTAGLKVRKKKRKK